MKKILILLFIYLSTYHAIIAQSIEVDISSKTLKEGTALDVSLKVSTPKLTADKDYWIGESISGEAVKADITFKVGTTTHDFEASRLKVTIKAGETSSKQMITISAEKDGAVELLESGTVQFQLYDADKSGASLSSTKIDLNIISDEQPTSEQLSRTLLEYYPPIEDMNIFLGGGLKINGNSIFDSFAFEWFIRNWDVRTHKNGWKFGMFGGIYQYTYSQGDSTQNISSFVRLQNPTDPVQVGTRIIRETYGHTYNVRISSLGAYADFVFSPPRSSENARIGIALHVEVANSNSKYTNSRTLVRRDSVTFTASDSIQGTVVAGYAPIFLNNVYRRSTNGYFGIGLPMSITKRDKYEFFFHPIFGATTFTPANYDFGKPEFVQRQLRDDYHTFYPFYLVRAQLSERYTALGITLGCEVRGIIASSFPDPSFVLFVASRINISRLIPKS